MCPALAMVRVPSGSARRTRQVVKPPWLRPMILCGQHSLVIFCLGVFLAFAGYFLLDKISASIGVHFLVAMFGILMMSAVAWMASWYKQSDAKLGSRGNADIAGG